MPENKIYNNATIGFEFEFFTEKNYVSTRASLRKALNAKVIYTADPKSDEYNQILKNKDYALSIDKSGGFDMFELVTPPLPYYDAIHILKTFLEWVNINATTNIYSGIHVNISLANTNLAKNLNKLKYITSFNEDLVYKAFPKRKNNIYCQSIREILPKNLHTSFLATNEYGYEMPDNKYFGVNFTKIPKNYLEFRYIGGKNYHKRVDDIITLTQYFIIHLAQTLKTKKLNTFELASFERIMEPIKKLRENILTPEIFRLRKPRINITVDLNNDLIRLKLYWNKILPPLFKLLAKNKILGNIDINYNSDLGMLEIANNDKIKGTNFSDIAFFNCTITGVIKDSIAKNCKFYRCSVYNSNTSMCEYNESKIYNSIARMSDFNDVYVSNSSDFVYLSGNFNNGIIIKTCVLRNAFFIDETAKNEGLIQISDIREIDASEINQIKPM